MKKRSLFWGTVVSSLVMAFNSMTASAGPGFYKSANKTAPNHVQRAAAGVYRFVVLNETRAHVYKYENYMNGDSDGKGITLLKNGSFVERLIAKKLQECLDAQEKECIIPYQGNGTAFILGDNHDYLMTARHNLKIDALAYQEALHTEWGDQRRIWLGADETSLTRNMPLHFILFDIEGNPVFDTRNSGDYASPDITGSKRASLPNIRFNSSLLGDFAVIRLSRAVGNTSLKFRKADLNLNEKLTVVGFPSKTYTRQSVEKSIYKKPIPDSDGLQQYYSTGKTFPTATVFQFMQGPGYIPDTEGDERLNQAVVFADTETVEGFSGSPLIDNQGRVAALVVGRHIQSSDHYYSNMNCIGLSARWLATYVSWLNNSY